FTSKIAISREQRLTEIMGDLITVKGNYQKILQENMGKEYGQEFLRRITSIDKTIEVNNVLGVLTNPSDGTMLPAEALTEAIKKELKDSNLKNKVEACSERSKNFSEAYFRKMPDAERQTTFGKRVEEECNPSEVDKKESRVRSTGHLYLGYEEQIESL